MSAARRSGRSYPISADVSTKSSQRSNLRDAQPLPPTGPCSFRDLSAGHVCGCRRFWPSRGSASRSAHTGDNGQDDASCICGHHGCFHDLGYENVDGLSGQHTSLHRPAIASIETSEVFEVDGTSPRRQGSSLLDRNSFGGSEERTRRQVNTPPEAIGIRSQKTGSVGSRLHLQQHICQDARSNRSSATEIASTPTRTAWLESRTVTRSALDAVKSRLRTLDIGESIAPDECLTASSISPIEAGSKRNSTQPPHTEQLHEQLNALKALVLSVPDVQHALSGIYQRLEAIENMSSSQEVPDDLTERLELLEHLEVRTIELEAKLNSLDTAGSFRDDHSVTDTSRKISARNSEDQSDMLLERLDEIEHRLINIEGRSLPSSQSPWSVEVVVIPWGTELNGLWFPDNTNSAWAQMIGNSSHHSGERFMSRACGPSHGDAGLVYCRLLSCGLIRVVQFIDNSAYHIQSQLLYAYSDVMATLSSFDQDKSSFRTQLSEQFLGLQSVFIPLRKVHRQSTLEHLNPAEMVTPVLWTASFLESSVFMKAPRAGLRRLYMTTPEGYLQPSSGSCTWATLRALSTAIGGTHHADASVPLQGGDLECWNWNRRLDPSLTDFKSFPDNALGPQDNRSTSAFVSKSATQQKRGSETPLQHQPDAIVLPDVKHEPISDEDITYMPITPTSIFPSSQSHSRNHRKQSPTHQRSDSRVTTSPGPSRSAPPSQKRALTSSFDSCASVESQHSRTSSGAVPSSRSHNAKPQRPKKRTRLIHQPWSPTHATQSPASNSAHARAALAYATPYSWNPAEDSPKGHDDGHPEADSGDTEAVHTGSSAGSESDGAREDDDADSEGGNEGAAASSVQLGVRRAARLLSPLNSNLLTDRSVERRGIRYGRSHIENRDLVSIADPEHDQGNESVEDSMDEEEDEIMDEDEDDAMIEDDADNDNDDSEDDDDDDSHEMSWR